MERTQMEAEKLDEGITEEKLGRVLNSCEFGSHGI